MGHAPNSTAISGGTWTLLKAFADNKPKGVSVLNDAASANAAEVFVVPMHGTGAPSTEDGWPLAVGAEKPFFDAQAKGGDGRIEAVYGKSTGATLVVGVDVR